MIKITSPDGLFKRVIEHMLASEGFCFDDGSEPIEIVVLDYNKIEENDNCQIILHHDYKILNGLLEKIGVEGRLHPLPNWKEEKISIRGSPYPILLNYSTDMNQNVVLSSKNTPLSIQKDNKFILLQDILTISRNMLSGLSHIKREKGLLDVPIFDIYSSLLTDIIEQVASKNNIPIIRKSRWPDEHDFAIALTHDIERIVPSPKTKMDRIKKRITKESPISHTPQFEIFHNIEKKFGMNSTHFFLDNTSWFDSDMSFHEKKAEEVIKLVINNGDEVGLHGSYFSYPDHNLFKAEKERLEKVSGMPVRGNRQHFLNMDAPHTWKVHESAGLLYDTTMGYNDKVGFRVGTAYPFKPLDLTEDRVIDIWEIPLAIMDVVLFREKPWLDLSLDRAIALCKKLLDEIKEFSGGASILWHPEYFMDEKYTSSYESVLEMISNMKGWATTGSNIVNWLDIYNSIDIKIIPGNENMAIVKFDRDMKVTDIKAESLKITVDNKGERTIYPISLKDLMAKGELMLKI